MSSNMGARRRGTVTHVDTGWESAARGVVDAFPTALRVAIEDGHDHMSLKMLCKNKNKNKGVSLQSIWAPKNEKTNSTFIPSCSLTGQDNGV